MAYKKFVSTGSQAHLQEYYEAHNNYVQQLQATNSMIKLYQIEIVPRLLEEIQESYLDTSATIASSIHSSIEMLATKVRNIANCTTLAACCTSTQVPCLAVINKSFLIVSSDSESHLSLLSHRTGKISFLHANPIQS